MPKQKSKSSSRGMDMNVSADNVANGRATSAVEHKETTILLHPGTSQSSSDLQLPVPSSSVARYSPIPGRSSSPVRKSSAASNVSSTTASWKLKYQDFMPRPPSGPPSADSWKTTDSFL